MTQALAEMYPSHTGPGRNEPPGLRKPGPVPVETLPARGHAPSHDPDRDPDNDPDNDPPAQSSEADDAFRLQDWSHLVERIHAGDPRAMEELYSIFGKGIRYFLLRSLGTDELEDRVHDCFVIVAQAIQNGEVRDPARLMGYVRTVVKRQIAATIDQVVVRRRTQVDYEESLFSLSDWKADPEQSLEQRQREEIARRVLNGVSRRDREILHRFYVEEQAQDQICEEMGLTYNQFRLLKSRAKARFGDLGRRLTAAGFGGLKKL